MRRHRPDVSVLAGTDLFAGYDERALAPLAAHADRLTVLPGATLARAGRHPHEVVVLLSGEAQVLGGPADGSTLGPGAVIGASEELEGVAHAATVEAASGVSALVLTGPAFRWAAQELPGFRARLAVTVPRRSAVAA